MAAAKPGKFGTEFNLFWVCIWVFRRNQHCFWRVERAGYQIQVLKTTHAFHALEYCQNAPLEELLSVNINENSVLYWPNMVTVLWSRDGLRRWYCAWSSQWYMKVFNVNLKIILGFYKRPDYNKVRHIPLGFIPGGSGNAIYKNIAVDSQERDEPENAAFVIAKGWIIILTMEILMKTIDIIKPIDMTLLQTESGKRILMMLSLSWAFMSDCDLESERWATFFWGVAKLIRKTKFEVLGRAQIWGLHRKVARPNETLLNEFIVHWSTSNWRGDAGIRRWA